MSALEEHDKHEIWLALIGSENVARYLLTDKTK